MDFETCCNPIDIINKIMVDMELEVVWESQRRRSRNKSTYYGDRDRNEYRDGGSLFLKKKNTGKNRRICGGGQGRSKSMSRDPKAERKSRQLKCLILIIVERYLYL